MDATRPAGDPVQIDHPRIPARVPPRRRPSGEPPPLPHHLGRTGKFWLIMVAYFVVTAIGVLMFPTFLRFFERWDTERLRWLVVDPDPVAHQDGARRERAHAGWTIRVLRWGTFAALIAFRRWRHLFVFIGAIIVLELLAYQLGLGIGRRRPLGVTILRRGRGTRTPSQPVAGLAVTLIGMAYALVVPGEAPVPGEVGHRRSSSWPSASLGCTWPSTSPRAATFGAILGVAVGLTAFRWFTPERRVPRDVPARQGRAPRRRGRRGRGDRPRRRRISSAST